MYDIKVVMNPTHQKPKILLIPDIAWWVIGDMARQIIARFSSKYEFYLVPGTVFDRRPDLLQAMVPAVDLIHILSDDRIEFFRNYAPEALPPIITWIHHVTTWSPEQQKASEMSAALTTCTPEWKQYLDERVSRRIPVTVVPHGVDTQFFARRAVDGARFGIPPGRFVVGFLGSKGSDDHGRKGTDVLLDVARKAAARIPNLHLVLGGPGWDKEVENLKAAGISASSTGYLRKADVPNLYSALDVYLLTSRVEGGPCTVFEAMACETAVVSTRVGAVPGLIVDGLNGFSADVGDNEGLLSAIIELAESPLRRSEIAKNGRNTVAKLSWGAVLTPLEHDYDELIARYRKTHEPVDGPQWMNDPKPLLRASCSADAFLHVYESFRRGSMKAGKAVKMLSEMLGSKAALEAARGAALVKGFTYRIPPV